MLRDIQQAMLFFAILVLVAVAHNMAYEPEQPLPFDIHDITNRGPLNDNRDLSGH